MPLSDDYKKRKEDSKKKLDTLLNAFRGYELFSTLSTNLPTQDTVKKDKKELEKCLDDYSKICHESENHDNADTDAAFIEKCKTNINVITKDILYRIEYVAKYVNNKKTVDIDQTTNQQQQNEKRALTYTERQKYRGIIAKSMNELFDVKTVSKFGEPQEFLLDQTKIEEKYQDLNGSFALDAEGKLKTDGLSQEDKLLVETAYNRMERVHTTWTNLQATQETKVTAHATYAIRSAEYSRSRLELMLVSDSSRILQMEPWMLTDIDTLRLSSHKDDPQLIENVKMKVKNARDEVLGNNRLYKQEERAQQQAKRQTEEIPITPPAKESTPTQPIKFTIKEYPPTSEPKQTAKENAATTPDKLATTTAGAANPTPIQEETAPKVDSSRQKKSPIEVYDERYKKNGTYTEGYSQPTVDLKTKQTTLELRSAVDCEQYLQSYVTENPGAKFDIIADNKKHHFDPIDILDEDKREEIDEWMRQDIGNALGIQLQPEEPSFWEKMFDKLVEWMCSSSKKDDPASLPPGPIGKAQDTTNVSRSAQDHTSVVSTYVSQRQDTKEQPEPPTSDNKLNI